MDRQGRQPRAWRVEDFLDLGEKAGVKTIYMKAIPVFILEEWLRVGKGKDKKFYIWTNDIADRLISSGLRVEFKNDKAKSSILAALTRIENSRNLTDPSFIKYKEVEGNFLVNLPYYESILQLYVKKLKYKSPDLYNKLFPNGEPNWESLSMVQPEHKKVKPTPRSSEVQNEIQSLLAPIEQTLRDQQQAVERLKKENQKLQAELIALQKSSQDGYKASHRIIVDDELRSDCEKHLESKETYIDAIRRAGVVLEVRLRKTIGGDGQEKFMEGVALVDYALTPNTGKLIISDHPAEQEGVRMLFRGAVQFVRNPPAHKKVQYAELEAWQTISLIDYLLFLLKQVKPKHG